MSELDEETEESCAGTVDLYPQSSFSDQRTQIPRQPMETNCIYGDIQTVHSREDEFPRVQARQLPELVTIASSKSS